MNEQRGGWEQTARMNKLKDRDRLQELGKEGMETESKNEQRRGWELSARMNKGGGWEMRDWRR
jgi:hypothetical protein